MFMGLGMPIPDLSNKPGPGRPGWGPTGSYDFQFEVTGAVTVKANAAATGTFRISWPNGTTNTYSGDNASIAAPDGTAGIVSINNEELDTTYADEFAVVGGQTNVTKVISWGRNPWNNLTAAFSGCTNLTTLEESALITDSNGNLYECFNGCTGLTTVNGKKWNLSAGARIGRWFNGCTNLELLELTGISLNLIGASDSAFQSVGVATTNGCEFQLSGLTLTQPSSLSHDSWFRSTKIKPTSTFANITWPSNYFDGTNWFYESSMTGTSSILDCSGWSTFNGTLHNWFSRFNWNGASTSPNNTNQKINLTNFSGKTTSISGIIADSSISGIIGLSTWGATDGSAINFGSAFKNARVFAMDASDNFSNAFISSCNVSSIGSFYEQTGNDYNGTLVYGAAPNFTNLNCSNITSFANIFHGARLNSNPDFNSITYPSTAISFSFSFRDFRFQTYSGSHIDFSTATLKISSLSSAFRGFGSSIVEKLTFGNNVDFSQLTSLVDTFRNFGRGTGDAFPTEITLPTNADYSSVTSASNMFFNTNYPYTIPALSTCQVNYFIRNLYSSRQSLGSGGALTINMPGMSITEAPSVVRSTLDDLVALGYNISGIGATDAALPFAYASYAVDPTGITTISPTTTPPAGSVFTATNSLSINSSTGVITPGSFRGGSTIRCTYPDGCYNEVVMLIQAPFIMRIVIPSSGSTTPFTFKPQMSASECFIDWGDATETLTGNTTHDYPAAGSDTTYDIKVFDSPSGSKFTGMSGAFIVNESAAIDKSIMQWGEIEWQNNTWFSAPSHNQNKLRISAPNGAAHKPNLSQVTSLQNMFGVGVKGPNQVFEDVNNNLADWDVSTVTNMQQMFNVSGAPVNRPSDGQPNTLQISNWDVSNVTNFSSFGFGSLLTANGVYVNYLGFDMTNWDTSAATNMSGMFHARGTLIGVENFNTSNVTDMNNMFSGRPVTGIDFKTKLVNGTVRWSVKKVANFSNIFRGYSGSGSNGGGVTNSTFPTNWWISGEGQDVNMFGMYGNNYHNPGRFNLLTDSDAFATKTIASGSSPYGSSYTAWDMSNTTSLENFAYSGTLQMLDKNYNISSWQISNKCTSLSSLFTTRSTSYTNMYNSFDQDLGHWDVSNVTAINTWMGNIYPGRESNAINFSIANYDSLLDITDGWGQDAGSVQSGVTINMGASQYSPGNVIYVNWNANNSSSGNNTLLTPGFNLQAATSVGDIIYYPASVGTTTTAYARITGYNSINEATTTTTNWPSGAGSVRAFEIYNSNAAKGRFALVEAGWNITDGGVYIPFDPTELEINVQAGDTMRVQFQTGTISTHIDWNDGNGYVAVNTTTADKTYTSAGTYTIRINETAADSFPGFNFASVTTAQKQMLTKIKKWGTNPYQKWYRAFYGCSNITSIDDTASPNLTSTTTLAWAFSLMQGLTTFDFSNWVFPATLVSFYRMFWRDNVISNASFNTIVNWDVSNITNFQAIFEDCSLMNANISGWDTSSATDLSYMFSGASVFNQDISQWKTSNATTLAGMFNNAFAFNQDINTKVVGSGASAYIAWDTSNNTGWNGMFRDATAFNQPIDKWEIAQVSNDQGMAFMFGRTSVFNQDLLTKDVTIGAGTPVAKTYVAWDVSYIQTLGIGYNSPGVPTYHGMFESNTVFNGDISNWDIPSTNARSDGKILNRMFISATAFNGDISEKTITNVTGKGTYNAWDISSATQLNSTFNSANAFNQNLSDWRLNISTTNFDNIFRSNSNVGMSTNNYTDTLVGWANYVKNQTPDAPLNVQMNNQYGKNFESSRSGGANFTNAAAARTFLTGTVASGGAGWTINGDTIIPLPFSPLKFKVNIQTTTTTSNLDFNIPYVTGTNFTINWGDSNTDTNLSATNSTITHQYSTAGTYTIEVGASNSYPTRLAFNTFGGNPNTIANNGALAVTEITQWGSIPWSYVESMWDGCTNLDIMSATDTPDFSNLISHSGSFPSGGLTRFLGGSTGTAWQAMRGPSLGTVNASINTWDVSSVRDFSGCFAGGGSTSAFNANISNWDLSGVTKTGGLVSMFHGCLKFNQPLSNWTLPSPVTSLNGFLMGCEDFNQDISHFNMTNIIDIGKMFYGCDDFNATNLQNWERTTAGNTSTMANITNMADLFNYKKDVNKTFNNAISSWNTSRVTSMANLSANVTGNGQGMTSAFVTGWDTSSVSNFSAAFKNAYDFNSNLGSLNITSLTNASQMFYTWASGQSTANYTDTIIGWATFVKAQTPDAPLNVNLSSQNGRTFDTTRTASGFTPATAGRARSFLTLDVTVSGSGDSSINGVYYYDYANSKWVRENDANIQIDWNGDESVWELSVEGEATNNGSGGSQAGGPASVTSWSGGLTVVDSSKGWTITSDTITS